MTHGFTSESTAIVAGPQAILLPVRIAVFRLSCFQIRKDALILGSCCSSDNLETQIVKAQTSSQSHAASKFDSPWAAVVCEIAGMGKVSQQTGK
jgi:hypothetical protein